MKVLHLSLKEVWDIEMNFAREPVEKEAEGNRIMNNG